MPLFKEIRARVCQTVFLHTFLPFENSPTTGISRVIIVDEEKENLGTGPVRSSTHPPPTILKRTTRVRVASTTTTANNNNNDNNSRSGESSSGIVGENSFEPSRSRSFHDKPAFETWIGNFSLPNNIWSCVEIIFELGLLYICKRCKFSRQDANSLEAR